jgi:hypothetical protein
MTRDAIIFMASVWTVILACTLYCFWKLLNSKRTLGGDDEA